MIYTILNGFDATAETQTPFGDHMEEATPILEEVKPITSIFDKCTAPQKDWICPISFKLMVDPVVAQDGNSYERVSIETWFTKNSTSPMDRSVINDKRLHKNIALYNIIKVWAQNNPDYMKEEANLDRQLEEQAMRMKPVTTASPVISRSPSQYITHIASVTFPGWNIVNLDNSIMYGNRSPRGAHHTPRSLGIIPRALSFSLSPQNSSRVVPV
jgi:hypothetical protein